jgi:hypothetical protein
LETDMPAVLPNRPAPSGPAGLALQRGPAAQRRPRVRRLLLALVALAGGAAQAATWSLPGSAGIFEPDIGNRLTLTDGIAAVSDGAVGVVSTYLRYPVTALAGFKGNKTMRWRVRFRDNGDEGFVRLTLRQYRASDGVTTSIASFDSDDHDANALFQLQSRCITVNWNFANGPYYIHAQLARAGANGRPALAVVELTPEDCTP